MLFILMLLFVLIFTMGRGEILPYEAPLGADVYATVEGTWDWQTGKDVCRDNPHTISFSPDRDTMILRYPQPIDSATGQRAVRYEIRDVTPSRVRGFMEGRGGRPGRGRWWSGTWCSRRRTATAGIAPTGARRDTRKRSCAAPTGRRHPGARGRTPPFLPVAQPGDGDGPVHRDGADVGGDYWPVGGEHLLGDPERARGDEEREHAEREVLRLLGAPGADDLRQEGADGEGAGDVADVLCDALSLREPDARRVRRDLGAHVRHPNRVAVARSARRTPN